MQNFIVEDLGLIEYEKAWKLQDEYAAEIATGTRPPTSEIPAAGNIFVYA